MARKTDEELIAQYIKMKEYEEDLYAKSIDLVGGIDEAGRGPLAGPVVAACVILPKDCYIKGLNDSKKLSEKKREQLFDEIKKVAISIGVGIVDNHVIDDINILNATKKAMLEAVSDMDITPKHLLIDAVKLDTPIPSTPIIKGDALSVSIAAASIIAKVTRDKIMYEYDVVYPEYLFAKHKGYGTAAHLAAIKECGLSDIHRRSFTKKFV